jgi:hypothetical protein
MIAAIGNMIWYRKGQRIATIPTGTRRENHSFYSGSSPTVTVVSPIKTQK